MAEYDLRPLSVGEILDVSFGLFRRLFASLLVVQVVCMGVPMLLAVYLEASGGIQVHYWLWAASSLASLFLTALASVASVHVIAEHYLGRSLSVADALARSGQYVWPVVVLSFLLTFVVGLGLLLLVVPGIILGCGLSLSTQTLVLEPRTSASAAMSRSWELSKGFRGRLFVLLVTFLLLVFIPGAAIGALIGVVGALVVPGGAAPESPVMVVLAGVIVALMRLVVTPLLYCLLTVAYYDLRVRKEGFDLEMLAQAIEAR